MKYRKKPVVIEARQFDGRVETATPIINWALENEGTIVYWCDSGEECMPGNHVLLVTTLEGNMRAPRGWWIIRGVQGEFYPCDPDVFEASYEAVEEQS